MWGTKSISEALTENVQGVETELWGRDELADVARETTGKPYNEEESAVILLNSRARPGRELRALASRKVPFAAVSAEGIVAARVNLRGVSPGVITIRTMSRILKEVPRLEVPAEMLHRGYWDLVNSNGLGIAEQAEHFGDSQSLPSTAKLSGPPSSLRIHGSAVVEDYVCFDARPGPIVVAEGASIESFSRISGPCYIGRRAKILSALVRGGSSIFDGCKVGGEVENSVLMQYTNKAHLGYVGDSYVGEWVNLGAGSTFSNLKNTYGNVRIEAGGARTDTGMVKLGPAIGDMSKVSIGAMVFAGKKVGSGSHVTGLASTDIPSFTYFDSVKGRAVEIRLESVLETQRRMKERRGFTVSRAEEELIVSAFRRTASERKEAGVKKGRIV
jgi:UDP-N-acetylglucosamine diphosphorylase/glucosamine-1-phosphate N-acetyltransferase